MSGPRTSGPRTAVVEPGAAIHKSGRSGLAARRLKRHETLYHAGDDARFVFEITRGSVLLYKFLADGRRQVIDFIREGGFCGLSSSDVHEASCEALEETVVNVIDRASFDTDATLRSRLAASLEDHVCDLQDHALTLGRKTALERVATFLIDMVVPRSQCDCDGPLCPRNKSVHVPMTRGEMADYLGLSLETVCRSLTDLERQHIISVGRRHGDFVVVDACGLCRQAQRA